MSFIDIKGRSLVGMVSYFATRPEEFYKYVIYKHVNRWNEVLGNSGGDADFIFLKFFSFIYILKSDITFIPYVCVCVCVCV